MWVLLERKLFITHATDGSLSNGKASLPHVGPLEGAEPHAGFWILGKTMKFPLQLRENVPGVALVLCNF